MDTAGRKERIERLYRQIGRCRRCPLHRTRTHTVPGEGSLDAKIMFVGEAPGKTEDRLGRPFVGRAGEILDRLLASLSLNRHKVYICNILKCRPPGNRDPQKSEISACVGSLDIQIQMINPDIIATLGRFATVYIFEKFGLPREPISRVHGQVFSAGTPFGEKNIIPFFHPAIATYDPQKLNILFDDFKIFNKIGITQSRS